MEFQECPEITKKALVRIRRLHSRQRESSLPHALLAWMVGARRRVLGRLDALRLKLFPRVLSVSVTSQPNSKGDPLVIYPTPKEPPQPTSKHISMFCDSRQHHLSARRRTYYHQHPSSPPSRSPSRGQTPATYSQERYVCSSRTTAYQQP